MEVYSFSQALYKRMREIFHVLPHSRYASYLFPFLVYIVIFTKPGHAFCRKIQAIFAGVSTSSLADTKDLARRAQLEMQIAQLSQRERVVALLIDEIHVKQGLEYKGIFIV